MGLKENLKIARDNSGFTLEEVANKIGITKPTLQRYESGKISNIPSDKIESLAKIYDNTPAWLMGWEKTIATEDEIMRKENDKLFMSLSKDKRKQALEYYRFLNGQEK